LNHGLRFRLNVEFANIFNQEFDKILTAQGLDCFQYFRAEYFDVIGHEVVLQFAGTSPHERAESQWALVLEHVHIPHVSYEFLGPPEGFATIRTGRTRLAGSARGTISPVLRSALGSEILPDSLGLSLEALWR